MDIELNEAQLEMVRQFDNRFDPKVEPAQKLSNSDLVSVLESLTTDHVQPLISHYLNKNIQITDTDQVLQLYRTLLTLERINHKHYGQSKSDNDIELTKQLHQKIVELYSILTKAYLESYKIEKEKLNNATQDSINTAIDNFMEFVNHLILKIKQLAPRSADIKRRIPGLSDEIGKTLEEMKTSGIDTTDIKTEKAHQLNRLRHEASVARSHHAQAQAPEAEPSTPAGQGAQAAAPNSPAHQHIEAAPSAPTAAPTQPSSKPIGANSDEIVFNNPLRRNAKTIEAANAAADFDYKQTALAQITFSIDELKNAIRALGADKEIPGHKKLGSSSFFLWPSEKSQLKTLRNKVNILEALNEAIINMNDKTTFKDAWLASCKNKNISWSDLEQALKSKNTPSIEGPLKTVEQSFEINLKDSLRSISSKPK